MNVLQQRYDRCTNHRCAKRGGLLECQVLFYYRRARIGPGEESSASVEQGLAGLLWTRRIWRRVVSCPSALNLERGHARCTYHCKSPGEMLNLVQGASLEQGDVAYVDGPMQVARQRAWGACQNSTWQGRTKDQVHCVSGTVFLSMWWPWLLRPRQPRTCIHRHVHELHHAAPAERCAPWAHTQESERGKRRLVCKPWVNKGCALVVLRGVAMACWLLADAFNQVLQSNEDGAEHTTLEPRRTPHMGPRSRRACLWSVCVECAWLLR